MNKPVVADYYQPPPPPTQKMEAQEYKKQYSGGHCCEIKGRWVEGWGKGRIFEADEEEVECCGGSIIWQEKTLGDISG